MDDKRFDEMFKNLDSSKMEVDVDAIWDQVRPEEKKRKRFIVWWILAGTFVLLLGAYLWLDSKEVIHTDLLEKNAQVTKVDTKKPQDQLLNTNVKVESNDENNPQLTTNDLITDNHKAANSNKVIKNKRSSTHNPSLVKASQSNPSTLPFFNEKNQNKIDFTREQEKSSHSLSIKESNYKNDVKGTDVKRPIKDTKTILSIMDTYLDHLALQKMDYKHTLMLDNSWDDLSISFLPFDFEKDKPESTFWGVDLYSGYAQLNRKLDDKSGKNVLWIEDRKNTESERFSVVSGGDVFYKRKNWNVSLGLMYQKHYVYFQDSSSVLNYSIKDYQSTFFAKKRTIKSNVIISQLSANLFVGYSFKWNRWQIDPAFGMRYNFKTSAKGKFYTSLNEVTNVADEDGHYISEGWTPMMRLRIQYQIHKNYTVNFGFLRKLRSHSIISNEDVLESYNNTYMTVGMGIQI